MEAKAITGETKMEANKNQKNLKDQPEIVWVTVKGVSKYKNYFYPENYLVVELEDLCGRDIQVLDFGSHPMIDRYGYNYPGAKDYMIVKLESNFVFVWLSRLVSMYPIEKIKELTKTEAEMKNASKRLRFSESAIRLEKT